MTKLTKLQKIFIFLLLLQFQNRAFSFEAGNGISIDFLGDTLSISTIERIHLQTPLNYDQTSVEQTVELLTSSRSSHEIMGQIKTLKDKKELCDWLVYQLIRKTANQLIAKDNDYLGYTIAKWFLLKKMGYNAMMTLENDRVLLFVESNDIIYNIPLKMVDGKQYVCLNFHDYNYSTKISTDELIVKSNKDITTPFSFQITQLPKLSSDQYEEKSLTFEYGNQIEKINIKINSSLKNYFLNYPTTEYSNQFNIPFSEETKNSLVTALRKKTSGMTMKDGLEYIMYFTRYAFLFEKDSDYFGREKRLSPEETLLYSKSDCEDRSALFYALVKEIYNLPMIILSYPDHVTVGVKLDKPIGSPISYGDELYTIFEPTPQRKDLKIGQLNNHLKSKSFEVAFAYHPSK